MFPIRIRFLSLQRPGFLMLDVLLGISIFAIFISAVGVSLYVGQRDIMASGDRIRAITLAEQTLEAVRTIRDRDFALLTVGSHGTVLDATGIWVLSGTGTTSADGFRTTLAVTSLGTDRVGLTATTTWNFSPTRMGLIEVQSELTNWRVTQVIGNWGAPSLQGSAVHAGTPLYNDVAVKGNYAFVTSETSGGGVGLYVFDISNLAAPATVSTVALGFPGYQLFVSGTHLFVATGDTGAEIQVFDVSSPATLSLSNLVASVNVPGDGKVRAINIIGSTLFASSLQDATHPELFSYFAANLSAITLLDTFDDPGGFADIDLHNGYAYLPSTQDISEIRVADVFDPSNISIAAGSGYNLTDVQDGMAVSAFGTSALLGRMDGSAIEELVLFSIASNPVPTPPPGPWYYELGGTANGISVEPGGQYAFLATENDTKELQVVDVTRMKAGLAPEASSYDTDTGLGRGVYYDLTRDRVFLLTNTAFIVLRPG